MDYRQLNQRTLKDCYSLPRTDASLDDLGGSKWFSTFDLQNGYHQVEMDAADADNITFLTRNGSIRFKVMSFRLCNTPATFQRLMNVVLSGLSVDVMLVYLDDIIVHSTDLPSHLERLKILFQRLRWAELKLKISKRSLLRKEVSFLGHRISKDGVSTHPAKIQDAADWAAPNSLREIRSFVGLCS